MEMINLVDEFFKRNLTEAEAQNLEELLEKSPEASSRFGEMLRQEYLSLGLPEPKIPKNFHSPISIPPTAWLGPVLGFLALVGVAVVSLAWWMRPHSELAVLTLTASLPQKPIAAEVSQNPGILPPPPIQLPQKLGADSVEGNRLSVVVELEKIAQVQVRVMNPQEQSLRVLFEGPLSPGKWAIQWDGRLADGTQAESGKYLIQVKAGSQVMSKSVSVEPSK
jgi:hypothetical protein